MSNLRAELSTLIDQLDTLAASTREVTLDAVGDAIGSRAVSYDEIDLILTELERRGVRVHGATDGRLEERLRSVVISARELSIELRRRPSVSEIATRSGLSIMEVRAALSLARVMQR